MSIVLETNGGADQSHGDLVGAARLEGDRLDVVGHCSWEREREI